MGKSQGGGSLRSSRRKEQGEQANVMNEECLLVRKMPQRNGGGEEERHPAKTGRGWGGGVEVGSYPGQLVMVWGCETSIFRGGGGRGGWGVEPYSALKRQTEDRFQTLCSELGN